MSYLAKKEVALSTADLSTEVAFVCAEVRKEVSPPDEVPPSPRGSEFCSDSNRRRNTIAVITCTIKLYGCKTNVCKTQQFDNISHESLTFVISV
jgi:hypothetical protein